MAASVSCENNYIFISTNIFGFNWLWNVCFQITISYNKCAIIRHTHFQNMLGENNRQSQMTKGTYGYERHADLSKTYWFTEKVIVNCESWFDTFLSNFRYLYFESLFGNFSHCNCWKISIKRWMYIQELFTNS